MSNNTPDYENNLAFAPTSADDLNKQGRQVDVLVAALEKCERLEKQLKIAVEALEVYKEDKWDYEDEYNIYPLGTGGWIYAEEALKQIKELEDGSFNT